jgi:cell division initiation protein
MITPSAIQKKEFTKGVRGYKEDEVDAFLDRIAVDVEALLRENENLKDSLKLVTLEIERYRGSENAIFKTLESAKALMTDISASAEKRAEIVLKNAELDAERIRRDARESVERLTDDAVALSRRWELFSARFRNLLETELDRFDSFAANLMLDDQAEKRTRGEDPAMGFGQDVTSSTITVKTAKRP